MNIHLPAILGFTRYQGFDPSPYDGKIKLMFQTTKQLSLADKIAKMATWRIIQRLIAG